MKLNNLTIDFSSNVFLILERASRLEVSDTPTHNGGSTTRSFEF